MQLISLMLLLCYHIKGSHRIKGSLYLLQCKMFTIQSINKTKDDVLSYDAEPNYRQKFCHIWIIALFTSWGKMELFSIGHS